MTSLGLYLVLIMWACSTPIEIGDVSIPMTNTTWNVRIVGDYSADLAKLQAMRAFMDADEQSAKPLDASCLLQTFTATEIEIETLRRVVNSRGMD